MNEPISLDEFQQLAEAFAAAHLDLYVDELRSAGKNPARKEINDSLWGTIGLNGAEVAVIDSPVFQRLRLIRQLGVVHWVYPGAGHTRFEHALGVLRQVQYLCEAVNNLGSQQGIRDLIDTNKINLLRFAALFHDVGHAAFSHVSEHAIETLDAVGSVTSDFAREQKTESRSLSEIFAYYVVRSKSCRRLVEILADHDATWITLNNNRNANVDEIVEKTSRAIIGRSIDDKLPLLHEIISGPFDADKLDYFVRDSKAAGTPSLLDISRLIQKIAIRTFDSQDLPGSTGKDIRASGQKHILIGIKWSGISVLDELHLSRVLLYSKIYRHPKVIAIEQMVQAALLLIAKSTNARSTLDLVYNHNDDALLGMSDTGLMSAMSLDPSKLSEDCRHSIAKAAKIFENIRMRRLTVKAFQLQRTYPGDPLKGDETQKAGLIDFRDVIDQPSDQEAFRQTLIDEVEKILGVSAQTARSRADLEGAIAVHAVGKTPGGTQIGRAWLIPNTGEPLEFRNYLVNRTAWADSYLSDQPAGYVFAESCIADHTFVAMERLLRTEYNVRLPASALEASKRDGSAVQHLKQTLSRNGYFADAPYDIRPLPERLAHADVARSISSFVPKLESYHAPVLEDEVAPIAPNEAIRSWLRQFDNDDDVECATRVLDNLKMIERRDTISAIKSFLQSNKNFEDAVIVPFGSARDSSAIQSYFAADLKGTYVSDCLTLDEAVVQHAGRAVIFLDDFIGSGGQSADVLAAGFGRHDLRRDLGEGRDLFSNDIRKFLEHAKIGFVFTAGWDDGLEELRNMTSELNLEATVFRHLDESQIPFLENALSGLPADQVDRFLTRSRVIGTELLSSVSRTKEGESDVDRKSRLEGRALGYGNRGMLLASPFNVPTQTYTPLWAHGEVNGAAWHALLPRRKKQ